MHCHVFALCSVVFRYTNCYVLESIHTSMYCWSGVSNICVRIDVNSIVLHMDISNYTTYIHNINEHHLNHSKS